MYVMNKDQRIQQIISDHGEERVLRSADTVYPPLEAPDPQSGRFKELYAVPLKSASDWQGVPDDGIEFDRANGHWNFGDGVVVRVPEKGLSALPDITRITNGLLCSEKAYRAIEAIDPQGVIAQRVKVISKSGEAADYFAVFARNSLDPINWAQASVTVERIEILKLWMIHKVKGGGVRNDIPNDIHIIGGGNYYFSDELIESMRVSMVRGCEFVNVVTLSTVVDL